MHQRIRLTRWLLKKKFENDKNMGENCIDRYSDIDNKFAGSEWKKNAA
jgi:hypothetical protein